MKLILFFGIVLFLGLAAASVDMSNGCNFRCLDRYDPVWGIETRAGKTEKREFSNSCMMELENSCYGRNFVQL
ncbi:unnamed protein product [Nezara viridula]|uniref:Neuropeptide n=1 Tax=Nezara viridula TaxID=85310 RepID=A0A9P0E768_NEZVI|nr:unnamed protein product [Nezara viridula]